MAYTELKIAGAALLLTTAATTASADIVITEIMYNPASSEGTPFAEWIEIYNDGNAAVDISGWYIDDEDVGAGADWGPIAAATSLDPGQVAVIIPSITDTSTFRTEWSVPVDSLVLAVTWGNLNNLPSSTNEMLSLFNASDALQDFVNYDDSGDWPGDDGAGSIYLTDVTADNNDGNNWALSDDGVDGAFTPTGPTFSTSDVGSPGVITGDIPGPSVLALLMLAGAVSRRRQREHYK